MGEHTFDTGMERVTALTAELSDLTLARLEQIAGLDRSGEYLDEGYTSVAAFLVHRCGMGPGEANRQVFMARALERAPYAAKSVGAGRLNVNQFEVLAHAQARHPEPYAGDEPDLCEAVAGLTLPNARRLVEYWCQAHDDPAADAETDPSRVFLSKTFGGRGRLDGELTPEDHALLSQALDTLISEIVETTPKEDLVPMPQLRAQALAEVARRHLDSPTTPTDHGNRPHLTVVVDWEVLTGKRRDKTTELLDGTVITPSAAQRLACDANVCRLLTGPAGEILDMGRSRRTPSPPPNGKHSASATATADSVAAADPGPGATPTTSNTGPETTDPPTPTTSSSSAATTTPSSTTAAGPSTAPPKTPSSPDPTGAGSPTLRRKVGRCPITVTRSNSAISLSRWRWSH